jgi:pimeloyl-ACP methyl ester carboxylesterase
MAAFRALARAAARGTHLKSILLAVLFSVMSAAPFAAPPPPLKMNLDEFDARKKLVLLPNNQHLAYIDMGDPKGPPVVLIHGYTDNARDWVPLIPYLSRHYRLIVVDIRGHGRSDKPECCYARIDFAYDIKLLLDALHIPRADIVGHSLGSMITQVLAEQWPDRVRKVILISSTGGARPGTLPKKPAYDFASEIRKLKEPIDPDSPFMIEWWASPKPVNEEFIRRQRRDAATIPLPIPLICKAHCLNSKHPHCSSGEATIPSWRRMSASRCVRACRPRQSKCLTVLATTPSGKSRKP